MFTKFLALKKFVVPCLKSLVLLAIFFGSANYIDYFALNESGLYVRGLPLIFYHLSRLIFGLCIGLSCIYLGYFLLVNLIKFKLNENISSTSRHIFAFFLGATIFSCIFVVLGFLGSINKFFAGSILALPLLLNNDFQRSKARFVNISKKNLNQRIFKYFIPLSCTLFLITKVIFTASPDLNIWEHYLHYYQVVKERSSLLPNEIWHHFYNTKGAGINFAAISISDLYSVQIISAVFFILTVLVLVEILHQFQIKKFWPLLAACLLILYAYGNGKEADFFRVHALIMAYISFMFYTIIYSTWKKTTNQNTPILCTQFLIACFLGFYQPVVTALICCACSLLILIYNFTKKEEIVKLIPMPFGCLIGSLVVLIINFNYTGIFELTPAGGFWEIADRQKFIETFGFSGIKFFLDTANDTSNNKFSLNTFLGLIRYPVSPQIFYCMLLSCLAINRPIFKKNLLIFLCMSFIFPILLIYVLFRSESIQRLSIYTIFFSTIIFIVSAKALLDKTKLCLYSQKKLIRNYRSFVTIISFLFIFFSLASAFSLAISKLKGASTQMYQFAIGLISQYEAMTTLEKRSSQDQLPIEVMESFNKIRDKNLKLFSLTFNPSYGYLVPCGRVLSEPTYSPFADPSKIQTQNPNDLITFLKKEKIGYLVINLNERLFSNLAFSKIFNDKNFLMGFNLILKKDNIYFFKLKCSNEENHKISKEFQEIYTLKKTGILNFPFTKKFNTIKKQILFESHVNTGQLEIFGSKIMKDSLTIFQQQEKEKINAQLIQIILSENGQRGHENNSNYVRDLFITIFQRITSINKFQDTQTYLENLESNIYESYIILFGKKMADTFRMYDERFPFLIEKK